MMRIMCFIFFLLLIPTLSFGDEQESLQEKANAAKEKLEREGTWLLEPHATLTLLEENRVLNNKAIKALTQRNHQQRGFLAYLDKKKQAYTISAQSITGKRYLAHVYLEGYAPFKTKNPLIPLYMISSRKTYQKDRKQYFGRNDVWQSSRQAYLNPTGDCEDHAVLLADWLIEMKYDARVVIGDVRGNGHAWVIWLHKGKTYLLEATKKFKKSAPKRYPLASLLPGYHPQYMFNRSDFWTNTGSKFTTNYTSQRWVKKSRYKKKW